MEFIRITCHESPHNKAHNIDEGYWWSLPLFIHIAFPIHNAFPHHKTYICLSTSGCKDFIMRLQDNRTGLMFLKQMQKTFSCLIGQSPWVIDFTPSFPTSLRKLYGSLTYRKDLQESTVSLRRAERFALLVFFSFAYVLDVLKIQKPKPVTLKACVWDTARGHSGLTPHNSQFDFQRLQWWLGLGSLRLRRPSLHTIGLLPWQRRGIRAREMVANPSKGERDCTSAPVTMARKWRGEVM